MNGCRTLGTAAIDRVMVFRDHSRRQNESQSKYFCIRKLTPFDLI